MKLRRGYCYLADLDPQFGSEAGKVRPVVLLQTDSINPTHPSSLVCPITSQVRENLHLLRVHLHAGEGGLTKASDIMIDQLRAIDNRRIRKEIGKISSHKMQEIETKIKIVLELD